MARDSVIHTRLLKWADWRAGLSHGGLGHAGSNLLKERVDCEQWGSGWSIDEESSETDLGVFQLPSELRATVEEVYLGGSSFRKVAVRLCVSASTVNTRLMAADRNLKVWLAERLGVKRERDALERARFEHVQQGARAIGV